MYNEIAQGGAAMRDFVEFKEDLDCYLYTQRELDILYGKDKNVSAKRLLQLLNKTIELHDALNTLKLLGYSE